MADGYKIEGAEQLAKLTRKFRASDDKVLRRELSKALNRATRRSKLAVRASAQRLPHRGGLAAKIAASKIVVRNKTTGRDPVLQIVASNKHNIRAIDRGVVKHPVYGRRKGKWISQRVTPGFWSIPMRLNEPDAQRELAAAMDELQRKLSR